ncbi:MAG: enoyl-CoA hydratase/isomerase family protein [Actinobacteria bacterium]|nr:enoyl-CoA hydratase/isomerase family protein [Actinomycetota bacterium]
MDELLRERKGAVEVLTLNRPEKKNAFTMDLVQEMGAVMHELQFDDEVRAVVVTGAGDGFCTGADLSGGGGREDAFTAPGMRITCFAYSRLCHAMWVLEKPIIGAINGVAAGAGCNLAFSCDLLVASEKAKFIQVFVRRGLIADLGGTYFLPRLIGLAKAKELMFFGDDVPARKALEMGLVNAVVPQEELMDKAMEIADRLAAGPTRAIGMMKGMLNKSFESDLAGCLDREGSCQGIAVATADVVEGVTAFMEKRPPDFKGR